VKRLKGDKPWLQFELELLLVGYPDNAKFKEAVASITGKAKAAQPKSPAKVKPSTTKN
jgi:hypothetical protein